MAKRADQETPLQSLVRLQTTSFSQPCWRNGSEDLVVPAKDSNIESRSVGSSPTLVESYGAVDQRQESSRLEREQCRFKSDPRY